MPTSAEAIELVEALLAAWNERDLDRFTSLLTTDIYWHDLGMPSPPAVGRDSVRRFSESLLRAFPDFRYEIRGPICTAADGTSCVIPWTISATNTGRFEPPGFAPTGRKAHFSGLDYFTIRNGLVARIETRFDPAEPIAQLFGWELRPRPGSWTERVFVWIQRARAAWLRRLGAAA